jgi:hypothetical protein
MRYEVTFEGRLINPAGLRPDEIEAFVDSAVAELETLGAQDIDVSTNLQDGMIRVAVSVDEGELISVPVDADEITKAQIAGGGLIRCAIHAAGGGTAGWSVAWLKISTMLDELVDA